MQHRPLLSVWSFYTGTYTLWCSTSHQRLVMSSSVHQFPQILRGRGLTAGRGCERRRWSPKPRPECRRSCLWTNHKPWLNRCEAISTDEPKVKSEMWLRFQRGVGVLQQSGPVWSLASPVDCWKLVINNNNIPSPKSPELRKKQVLASDKMRCLSRSQKLWSVCVYPEVEQPTVFLIKQQEQPAAGCSSGTSARRWMRETSSFPRFTHQQQGAWNTEMGAWELLMDEKMWQHIRPSCGKQRGQNSATHWNVQTFRTVWFRKQITCQHVNVVSLGAQMGQTAPPPTCQFYLTVWP